MLEEFNRKVLAVGFKKDTRGLHNKFRLNLPSPEVLAQEIVENLGVAWISDLWIINRRENP